MITIYHSESVVQDLVSEIETRANSRGLHLYRYQTNSRRYSRICTVTYCLHSGSERPRESRLCDGACVWFDGVEGKTERCIAYRALSELLEELPV